MKVSYQAGNDLQMTIDTSTMYTIVLETKDFKTAAQNLNAQLIPGNASNFSTQLP